MTTTLDRQTAVGDLFLERGGRSSRHNAGQSYAKKMMGPFPIIEINDNMLIISENAIHTTIFIQQAALAPGQGTASSSSNSQSPVQLEPKSRTLKTPRQSIP